MEKYEKPNLEHLNVVAEGAGTCDPNGSSAFGTCNPGGSASGNCTDGGKPTPF